MTAPEGGVWAFVVTLDNRPAQDVLDSSPDSGCCFGFCVPYWLKNFHDLRSVNLIYWQGADDGVGVLRQGVSPLIYVFLILPAGLVRIDIGFGAVFEGSVQGPGILGISVTFWVDSSFV